MKIILAKPRGFCAGVNMAVSALEKAVERFGVPFYVYHEIVHNTTVVENFRRQGVVFVDSLEEVPLGNPVMFSAHGVSPEVRLQAKKRNLNVIDATCPLVRKVHEEVKNFAKEDYQIVLIGHPGHDEVVAVMSEEPQRIRLVAKPDDVALLPFSESDRLAFVMQTTLSMTEAEKIVTRLRERFPQIVGPTKNDICYATQNRQGTVRTLAKEADMLLVLGSPNSSNSRRLAEIGESLGVKSYLIDGPQEIQLDAFRGDETVLITSGASAPESVVQGTVELLKNHFSATVEERVLHEETLLFALPRELRRNWRKRAVPSSAVSP